MFGTMFAVVGNATLVSGKLKELREFLTSRNFLSELAEMDLAAAADSLQRAHVSPTPREHVLSARNHAESAIAKLQARADPNGASWVAVRRKHAALLRALAFLAILDLYLDDEINLQETLLRLRRQLSRLIYWRPLDRRTGAYLDIIQLPKLLYDNLTGNGLMPYDEPEIFYRRMGDLYRDLKGVELWEADGTPARRDRSVTISVSYSGREISVHFDGVTFADNVKKVQFTKTTTVGVHELLVSNYHGASPIKLNLQHPGAYEIALKPPWKSSELKRLK